MPRVTKSFKPKDQTSDIRSQISEKPVSAEQLVGEPANKTLDVRSEKLDEEVG